jgi:uncharacterized protein
MAPGRVKHRDLLGFLLFSHGWTFLWWGILVIGGWDAFAFPAVVLLVLGGIGPLLGGVVMTAVVGGRRGLADLARRIVDIRRIPWTWLAIALLLVPLIALVAVAIVGVLGADGPADIAGAIDRLRDPVALLAFAMFVLVLGPLPEEIGWRGYLLDRLQLRWSALTSSLLLGAAWAAWHAPLFFMAGYYADLGGPPEPVRFTVALLAASVLYTWIHNHTARSVLAAILFHWATNLTGMVLELSPAARTAQLLLTLALVGAVVAWWGPRHLRRSGPRPLPPHAPGPGRVPPLR